jgi:hypothetical protein
VLTPPLSVANNFYHENNSFQSDQCTAPVAVDQWRLSSFISCLDRL